MSVTLAEMADKLATTLLKEFELDGVVLKLHVGNEAAAVGVTAKERAMPKLDEIVCGEVDAMARYAIETHGARTTADEIHLPNGDGSHVVVDMLRGKEGNQKT